MAGAADGVIAFADSEGACAGGGLDLRGLLVDIGEDFNGVPGCRRGGGNEEEVFLRDGEIILDVNGVGDRHGCEVERLACKGKRGIGRGWRLGAGGLGWGWRM